MSENNLFFIFIYLFSFIFLFYFVLYIFLDFFFQQKMLGLFIKLTCWNPQTLYQINCLLNIKKSSQNLCPRYFQNKEKLGACLVPVFKNYFLLLKIKNTKNLFRKESMFLFFVFSVFSKTTILITIKRCFHCFFIIQKIDCFSYFLFLLFCVFLDVFCVFIKSSFTQPVHPHMQTLSSSLSYWN